MPTDWYAPFRAKMKELMPSLARVADGSHVWWYSARMNEWLKDVDGDAIAAYAAAMPAPTSTLGRRVVTCHGDFHAGNLVRDEVRVDGRRSAFAFPLKAAPATLE